MIIERLNEIFARSTNTGGRVVGGVQTSTSGVETSVVEDVVSVPEPVIIDDQPPSLPSPPTAVTYSEPVSMMSFNMTSSDI